MGGYWGTDCKWCGEALSHLDYKEKDECSRCEKLRNIIEYKDNLLAAFKMTTTLIVEKLNKPGE